MKIVKVNGVDLEYEIRGSGEPVLLISPVLADGFAPLLSQADLTNSYSIVSYHRRGWGGSTATPAHVTIETHAADAAALLDHLAVPRAHVGGHSSGAAVALQLALGRPELVQSLVLLEPSILSVPSAQAFLEAVSPAFEAYAAGEPEEAVLTFLSVASGLDREQCRATIEHNVPGAIAQATKDADTFFGVELPALSDWTFGAEHAASITQPVQSVLGTDTEQLWVEVAELLRSCVPQVEECTIDEVGHLLHIQRPEPVAQTIASFLDRHPILRPER
jgi:pimeloyl-ACP methyl ester carboxylesterase